MAPHKHTHTQRTVDVRMVKAESTVGISTQDGSLYVYYWQREWLQI